MTTLCRLCKTATTNEAIDPSGDMKFFICDGCVTAKNYFRCCQCDLHFAPSFRREEEDGATCTYCTGEQDWPFYEEVDL